MYFSSSVIQLMTAYERALIFMFESKGNRGDYTNLQSNLILY